MGIIRVDRSRIVAGQECRRMRYLNYHYAGRGIQPERSSIAILTGIFLHEGLEHLFHNEVEDAYVHAAARMEQDYLHRGMLKTEADRYVLKEQQYLLYGLIAGWAEHRYKYIQEQYRVASDLTGPMVEREFLWKPTDNIEVMLRFDAVLENRETGALAILDFKTLSYFSEDWAQQFEHSGQTYLYTKALAELTGREVDGIIYEGLIKGQRRKDKTLGFEIQNSPFCYGYKFGGDFPQYQTEYTAKKGWKKIAAWTDHGARAWYEQVVGPQKASEQFLTNPIINPVPSQVERWLRQTFYQEYLIDRYLNEINAAPEERREELKDFYFPLNETRCFKYGSEHKCPFVGICFNSTAEDDLLAPGNGFIPRVSHHSTEEQPSKAA